MTAVEQSFHSEDVHPIDIVESLAEYREWDFDRICEDQIAMAVEGQWRTYAITLSWSPHDETLRLVCTFECDPPENREHELAVAMDLANDKCWTGCFTRWREQQMMVFRYGLTLAGGAVATPQQIDAMLRSALGACERFYPAFQLVGWGDETAADAISVAIAEAYGRA
ncbi:YbjN domain-containing protein [Rubrimonas cliftonensis]|uniref:Sensory transduction regulator n=1 Tax=Rubrimonas cliftonensis TaxID=89524 RepID=A0A1H3VHW3_9RHOB|nr:YbjN domain-containing protein [Rubrimonas cliftonensis]SDZ74356.1 hypothetical protein SAMN05444370_101113 [Rubrimonas cliftonensis]